MGQLLQETAADSLQKVPARPRYLQLSRLVSRAGCCRCTKLKTSTSVPSHSVGSSCKVAASRNLPDAHRACTGCNRVYVARQKALNLVHGAHNSGMDEAACQENWDKFDNSLPDEIEVSCYIHGGDLSCVYNYAALQVSIGIYETEARQYLKNVSKVNKQRIQQELEKWDEFSVTLTQ